MVSRTPPIRPSQLLTLKALDPLDQQPESGEDDDGQADVDEVEHGSSLGFGGLGAPRWHSMTSVNSPEPDMSRLLAAPMRARGGS
jgi:hypothetical protein